ncbi:unnamed protein product [Sphagnum jensenii]
MSGKVKVLTVQFDVTNLDKRSINSLMAAVVAQGEEIEVYDEDGEYCTRTDSAEVLNSSVREVDVEDT